MEVKASRPKDFALPERADLESALPGLIGDVAARGLFNDPPALTVTYRK
jgi:CRISPR-associated protein Csb1